MIIYNVKSITMSSDKYYSLELWASGSLDGVVIRVEVENHQLIVTSGGDLWYMVQVKHNSDTAE